MTVRRSFIRLIGLTVLVAGAIRPALAQEREIPPPVNGVRFVYSLSEPRPNQFQLYITAKPIDARKRCALFIANVRTARGKVENSGKLDGIASFLLEPEDFDFDVWLTHQRVELYDDWYKRNQAAGRQGYGNPCLETKTESSSPMVRVARAGLPCDGLSVDVAGNPSVQHWSMPSGTVRVELTARDSTSIYTSRLSDIKPGSFKVVPTQPPSGGPMVRMTFGTSSGAIVSTDRAGRRFEDKLNELELACRTNAEATAAQQRLLNGK